MSDPGDETKYVPPSRESLAMNELIDWWASTSKADLEYMLPKVEAYGAIDLEIIGRGMVAAGVVRPEGVEYEEIGTLFYLLGKVARALSALAALEAPSDDTYLDTEIYAKMCRRIRHSGGWPHGKPRGEA